MAARKPKPSSETLSLELTENQREALIHATRLNRALKRRLQEAGSGTKEVLFSMKELVAIGDEAWESMDFVPGGHSQRLSAVIGKINDLLEAREAGALRAKREDVAKAGSIYQLKVTLKRSKPPIWRRIQVPDGTLGELHRILQVTMGWDDSHLHQFIIGRKCYGVPPEDDFYMDETLDEEGMLLSQVARTGGKVKFVYEYDFGDSWEHEIVVEKVLEPEPGVQYPRCVAGARACPPEDCGGVWGYAHLVEALADPEHPDHLQMKECYCGELNPEAFSVEEINKHLVRRST